MLRNLKLLLAYDGTEFHGWQFQPDLRTVQGTLEQALRRVVRHQVNALGCSRTDAGVHAAGYVAGVYTTHPAPVEAICRSVGSRLPKDMTLIHVADVPLTFHATRSAISKLYRYRIHNHVGRPCEANTQHYVYHVWSDLDLDAMCAAARHWVGTHDFTSFAAAGNVRRHNVRTIRRIDVYRHGLEVRFDLEGQGFLYKQVRNMSGTLIDVGRGRFTPEQAREILQAQSRELAGPTAPPRGLTLQWVRYDLTALPEPSPELLERAREARPPAGTARADEDNPPPFAEFAPSETSGQEPPACCTSRQIHVRI